MIKSWPVVRPRHRSGSWAGMGASPKGFLRPLIAPPVKHLAMLLNNRFYREYQVQYNRLSRSNRNGEITKLFGQHDFRVPDPGGFLSAFNEIFVNNAYDIGRVDEAKRPLMIDCGANIGVGSLYWLLRYRDSRVVAFEPDQRNYEALVANVPDVGNRFSAEQKALSPRGGRLLFRSLGTDTSSLVDGGVDNDPAGDAIKEVDTVSLKSILANHSEVDLLKIDIEGSEFEVIEDAKGALGGVKNMFVECHTQPVAPQTNLEIIHLLTGVGFRCYIQVGGGPRHPFTSRPANVGGFEQFLNIFCVRGE